MYNKITYNYNRNVFKIYAICFDPQIVSKLRLKWNMSLFFMAFFTCIYYHTMSARRLLKSRILSYNRTYWNSFYAKKRNIGLNRSKFLTTLYCLLNGSHVTLLLCVWNVIDHIFMTSVFACQTLKCALHIYSTFG